MFLLSMLGIGDDLAKFILLRSQGNVYEINKIGESLHKAEIYAEENFQGLYKGARIIVFEDSKLFTCPIGRKYIICSSAIEQTSDELRDGATLQV